jgi:peptidoglycan/LPS O-acetylase OafA/YrhL
LNPEQRAATMPSHHRRISFPLIDVLRGFAAMSVVVFHVIALFNWTSFPVSGPLVWFRIGGNGVDLFFVISGFVIALSAFTRLESSRYADFAKGFARDRFARIAPLYYLTCLIFIVFIEPSLIFVPDIWKPILSHAVFLHSWIVMHQGAINGVNWSVAVEMQFYLLMLLTAPWLRRANPWIIGVGAIVISWSWRAAAYLLIGIHGKWGVFPLFVYTTELPGMLDEFAAGILLARLACSTNASAVLARAHAMPFVLPLVSTILVSISLAIYWPNSIYWSSPAMVIAFKTLLALTCVAIIATACALQYPRLVKLSAPLRYLGTISYGIYLWHLPVILAIKRVPWVDGPRALPPVIILTLMFASLSWHFFERPLMLRTQSRQARMGHPPAASFALSAAPETAAASATS